MQSMLFGHMLFIAERWHVDSFASNIICTPLATSPVKMYNLNGTLVYKWSFFDILNILLIIFTQKITYTVLR